MMLQHWLLLIALPLVIGLIAQFRVKAAFAKYARMGTASGLTGAEVAREILQAANIHDVDVVRIDGWLGDHYDPTSKRLCLSSENFDNSSLAAVGIAAHETGHAIQHAKAYAPLQIRMVVVPATMVVSQMLPTLLFFSWWIPLIPFRIMVPIAAFCYLILAVFQLITLPVEFDASRRAKIILGQMGIIHPGAEADGVKDMLNAAAMTYVAAFISALGSLLYYALLLTGRRNN